MIAAGVAALGAYVVLLFARYDLGAGTPRYRVEAAATVFAAVVFLVAAIRRRRGTEPAPSAAAPTALWFAFAGLAILLYWPAFSVGFLSDDYGLVTLAGDWHLGAVTPVLFRPIPLGAWALLLGAGAGPVTLHALNVLLHGTAAWLTARMTSGWGLGPAWSTAAGLLMLTMPLSPEAVVWCSGVFDLSAAVLILLAVDLTRRWRPDANIWVQSRLILLLVAAVLCKESAAVGAGLVAIDAWVRRAIGRRLLVDLAIVAIVVGAFAAIRIASASGLPPLEVTKFLVQRVIFETFGGFAVPWHTDLLVAHPMLPVVVVAIVVGLVTAFAVSRPPSWRLRRVVAALAWMITSVLVVAPFLAVPPDLEASRYLYLAGPGWAVFIVVVASSFAGGRPALSRGAATAVGVLVVASAYGTRVHQRHWTEAAAMRATVERAALEGLRRPECPDVTVRSLPDNVRGAYVFRNSAQEAFERDLQLDARVSDEAGPCAFEWSDTSLTFVRR